MRGGRNHVGNESWFRLLLLLLIQAQGWAYCSWISRVLLSCSLLLELWSHDEGEKALCSISAVWDGWRERSREGSECPLLTLELTAESQTVPGPTLQCFNFPSQQAETPCWNALRMYQIGICETSCDLLGDVRKYMIIKWRNMTHSPCSGESESSSVSVSTFLCCVFSP